MHPVFLRSVFCLFNLVKKIQDSGKVIDWDLMPFSPLQPTLELTMKGLTTCLLIQLIWCAWNIYRFNCLFLLIKLGNHHHERKIETTKKNMPEKLYLKWTTLRLISSFKDATIVSYRITIPVNLQCIYKSAWVCPTQLHFKNISKFIKKLKFQSRNHQINLGINWSAYVILLGNYWSKTLLGGLS